MDMKKLPRWLERIQMGLFMAKSATKVLERKISCCQRYITMTEEERVEWCKKNVSTPNNPIPGGIRDWDVVLNKYINGQLQKEYETYKKSIIRLEKSFKQRNDIIQEMVDRKRV